MARVGVGDLYHVALNGTGFMVRGRGYTKKDAPVFYPRFSTGEQGNSELDLYKVFSIKDFTGKPEQVKYGDPEGYYDGFGWTTGLQGKPGMWPTPRFRTTTGMDATLTLAAVTVFRDETYAAQGTKLYKFNYTTDVWSAVKTDFANAISAMVVLKNRLWVVTSGGAFWSFDGTTWVTESAFSSWLLVAFNGSLYASQAGKLAKATPATGATVPVFVDDVGDSTVPIMSMVVFNHRLYIGKPEGLFVFDGSRVSQILDTSRAWDNDNFNFMDVFNGALYFNRRAAIYRYTGTVVELVHEFGTTSNSILNTYDMLAAHDRLFMLIGDTITATPSLYEYDGIGVRKCAAASSFANGSITVGSRLGAASNADGTKRVLFLNGGLNAGSRAIEYAKWQYSSLRSDYIGTTTAENTTQYWYSSWFDAGFPKVDKLLSKVVVDLGPRAEGANFSDADDRVYLYFKSRDKDGTLSSDVVWPAVAGNNKTQLTFDVKDLSAADQLLAAFRELRLNLRWRNDQAPASWPFTIEAVHIHYVLMPEYKRQWQLTLATQGTEDTPMTLADDETEQEAAARLREAVYDSRDSRLPVAFEDMDFTLLNGAINSAVTTVTVDSTNAFPEAGYIKIDDEVIKYTGKTDTTFTGCTRGAFSTTAASHADNQYVNAYFKVIVTDIPNESVVIPNQDAVSGQESEMTVVLREA